MAAINKLDSILIQQCNIELETALITSMIAATTELICDPTLCNAMHLSEKNNAM